MQQEQIHHAPVAIAGELGVNGGLHPAAAHSKGVAAVTRKARILIADDERTIANTLRDILALSGFEARAVYDGATGLETLKTFMPDLLITDVMMPLMTGIELALNAKEFCPDCKIVLFSGHAGTSEMMDVLHAKGHHFPLLSKPMHPETLVQRLHTWLD